MDMTAQMLRDVKFIVTSSGTPSVVSVTFTTPSTISPTVTKTLKASAIKHHLSYDDQGRMVSAKTARVTVGEAALSELGYPVRNAAHKVQLKDHLVSFVDSAGLTYNAVIREVMPDETTGLIVCMLGDKT